MKVKVTLMTENDEHPNWTKEEAQKICECGWKVTCAILGASSGDKIELVEAQVVEI